VREADAPAAADTGDATDGPTPDTRTATGQESGAPGIEPGSIAVLPFVNMSADAENEYFSDGISEELLNVLVKVEGLSVASRTSSFAYKGRGLSATSIGAELKVAHVLEGSVRRAGNRVRITAQLIDADSDRHLWSETYDRELDDIFAIQDEIAKAIVAALRETLGDTAAPVSVRADTENLDAYQLYLKARELFVTRTKLDESVRLFERAVELDPDFARGWEGLAAAAAVMIDWLTTYPDMDQDALKVRAEFAAERALALDPKLSMPWAARALLAGYERPADYTAVTSEFDRAIAADPRNATAYLWRGINWITLGFLARGQEDFDRCLEIDSAYANCLRWKSLTLLFQGDTDTALALYQQGMAAGFNDNRGNSYVEPLIRKGNSFAAILLMRELSWPVEIQQAVMAKIAEGRTTPGIAARIRHFPESWRYRYELSLLLRDYEAAAQEVSPSASQVEHWDLAYEGLRRAPEFKQILERFNVPAYWRAHGYPPQCRPVGEEDFVCDERPTGK
jgi:TolB-like protein/Tfp pilus assembly protein PilF